MGTGSILGMYIHTYIHTYIQYVQSNLLNELSTLKGTPNLYFLVVVVDMELGTW